MISASVMAKTHYVKLCIILYIAVLYPTFACNYIVGKWNAIDFCILHSLLRIMGSFMVDFIGLYFTLLGYEATHTLHNNPPQATEMPSVNATNGVQNDCFVISDNDNEPPPDTVCVKCQDQDNIDPGSQEAVTIDATLSSPETQACETKASITQSNCMMENIENGNTIASSAFHTEMSTASLLLQRTCTVIPIVLPDLIVATMLHCIFLIFSCRKCWWSWLYTLMMPLCLSSLVNINSAGNEYAYVNEIIWVLQHEIMFMILAPILVQSASVLLLKTKMLLFTLASIWIGTFFQMYVMVSHPNTINIVVRNFFTNAAFFLTGNLLCMCTDSCYDNKHEFHELRELRRRVQDLRNISTPKLVLPVFVIIVLLYLHHAYPYTDTSYCFAVFAGTPCLWTFDVCNARFAPCLLMVVAAIMQERVCKTDTHTNASKKWPGQWIYEFAQTLETKKVSLMCYASLTSFLFSFTLQKTIGNIMFDVLYLVVPVQVVLVTVFCLAMHGHAQKVAQPLIHYVIQYLQSLQHVLCTNNI